MVTATENTVATAIPGDTLTYMVTISATGADATGVQFSDPISDANLTLVPGSLRTTPLAFPDSYSAVGNISISIAAPGVLANDVDLDAVGGAVSVTPIVNGLSANGGNVNLAADGSFSYNPPAGFEGTDTFTYTLNDNDTPNQTDTGTVTITVSGMIWFINSAAGGGGDGRLSSPFNTLSAFNSINNGTGNHPAANDNIFLYSGSYTGPLTLLNNQKLIGQGSSASLQTLTGLTPPAGSAALPGTGGSRPTITSAAVANNVTLAQGNLIRGLDITKTAGGSTALIGSNFGNLTISEASVSNSGGVAINLNTGNPNATFTTVSASGGANGIVLQNTTGSFTVTGDGTDTSLGGNSTGGTIASTSGSDGAVAGSGIYLDHAQNVTLRRMHIHDHPNFGIRGLSVAGFTLDYSTVDGVNGNNGTSPFQEASIFFTELTGSGGMTRIIASGGRQDNVHLENTSGTLSSFTVSNSTIQNNSTSNDGNVGFHVMARTTANMTVTVSNCLFQGNRTDTINADAADNSQLNITISGNTIVAGTSGHNQGNLGIDVTASASAQVTFLVDGNSVGTDDNFASKKPLLNTGINVFNGTAASANMTGKVSNNKVQNDDVDFAPGVSNGFGIRVFNSNLAAMQVNVTGNKVRGVTSDYGILAESSGTLSAPSAGRGVLAVAVTSNDVQVGSGALDDIRLQARNFNTVCARISGNDTASGGAGFVGLFVRQANSATFNLEGLTAGSQTAATTQAFVATQNPAANTVGATAAASFTGVLANFCGGIPALLLAPGGVTSERELSPNEISDPSLSGSADAGGGPVIGGSNDVTGTLSQGQLDGIVAVAIARWSATGLTAQQLAALIEARFDVADLPGWYLGQAAGNHFLVDRDAGGNGWFIDPNPAGDTEFKCESAPTRLYTDPASAPAGHMDLLTTVLHEMGHSLGLPDSYRPEDRDNLMYGSLTKGERRLPAKDQAQGSVPGSIAGTHFLGGPLTLNIGTLPAGKAITITFQATVAAPFPVATTCQVTSEGTVSGSNFSSVSTDDPDVAGSSDPTVTLIQVAPTISCPANINVNAAPGQSSANVPFAATTTGCPIPTITYKIGATMITSPHLFPAGTTTVDATASNGNAPDATCSFTVAVNQLPVAGTDTIERNAKEDVKVKVATLLLNDTDADNDPLSITGVTSPTPGGATVVLNGNWVYYTRNGTAADSFTYTLSDGRGGIVVGTVNVNIKDTDAQSRDLLDITVDGGGAHIRSDGIPGRSYTIQFSNNANGPWQDLGTTAADTEGIYTFDDPAGTPQRFYRSVFRDP